LEDFLSLQGEPLIKKVGYMRTAFVEMGKLFLTLSYSSKGSPALAFFRHH
jgi:hypothetical protein